MAQKKAPPVKRRGVTAQALIPAARPVRRTTKQREVAPVEDADEPTTEVVDLTSLADQVLKDAAPADYDNMLPPPSPIAAEVDPVLVKMTQHFHAARRSPGRLMTVQARKKLCIVLPVPLALQIAMRISGIPLGGTFMQLVGKHGSHKTSFLIELFRMGFRWNSLCVYSLNETKFSPVLAEALLGPTMAASLKVEETDTAEEWMRSLQHTFRAYQKVGVDTRPFIYGLDSLSGKLSENTRAAIDKEGAPKQRFAIEAKKNTDFLKHMSSSLSEAPTLLVAVNHLKEGVSTDPTKTMPERAIPGGAQLGFQESIEFEMRPQKQVFRSSIDGGVLVKIKVTKNSLGETGHEIAVEKCWIHHRLSPEEAREARSDIRTEMWFDWGKALTQKLVSTKESDKPADRQPRKFLESLDLHVVGGSKVWSEAAGVPKSSPLSFTKFGELLESPEKLALRRLIKRAFAVHTYPVFDYREGWAKQRQREIDHLKRAEETLQKQVKAPVKSADVVPDDEDDEQ